MPYSNTSTAAVLEMEWQRTGNYGEDVKQDKQCEECGTADQLYEVAGMVYCKSCLIRELKSTMKASANIFLEKHPCSFHEVVMDLLKMMVDDEDFEWIADTNGVTRL